MRFSIKEMYNYKLGIRPANTKTFLVQGQYDPPADPETDTRPDFIKSYVDTDYATNNAFDTIINEKYGDYVFTVDCESVSEAYFRFTSWNVVYLITHNTELSMLYKAHTVNYNPIENYDRNEETTTATQMLNGGTSMVAPDDSELFTNVASGTSSANGSQTVTGHVHGNIGVTTNATMQNEVYNLYRNNAWVDYFISTIIRDSCILIDYGYNTI